MTRAMIKQYTKLVEFLSKTLGPDYEITLRDLGRTDGSIIAIANGQISGRTIGAPLTQMALQMIADKSYVQDEYRLNYNGVSAGNKVLRSSTMFIKDEDGKLTGLLCINFDDSRYQALSTRLFQLCHPDEFVDKNIVYGVETAQLKEQTGEPPESFHNSIGALADEVLLQIAEENGVSPDRMTQDEKMRVVDALDQKGVFMLKGAVNYVAGKLHCSQASIYRYLSRINKDKKARHAGKQE